jgi:tetratricopeptide (TPR) repeat protein
MRRHAESYRNRKTMPPYNYYDTKVNRRERKARRKLDPGPDEADFRRRPPLMIWMRMKHIEMQGRPVVWRYPFRQLLVIAAAFCFVVCAPMLRAQDSQGESSSNTPAAAPPEAPEAPKAKPHGKKNKDAPTKSAPDQPAWDPLRAEKDLEVGQYYMKKGDLDAAIDRFEDAAAAKPGFAIPYRYLGEAHEKKGQKREAIKSYTRYLDLYPHAEDAAKVRKKIDKLWSEVGKKDKSAG